MIVRANMNKMSSSRCRVSSSSSPRRRACRWRKSTCYLESARWAGCRGMLVGKGSWRRGGWRGWRRRRARRRHHRRSLSCHFSCNFWPVGWSDMYAYLATALGIYSIGVSCQNWKRNLCTVCMYVYVMYSMFLSGV